MALQVNIIATPDCFGTSVLGIADILTVSNQLAMAFSGTPEPLFVVQTLSQDGEPVTTYNGQQVLVSGDLSQVADDSIVILPAPLLASRHQVEPELIKHAELIGWLKGHHERLASVATHCSGSFLLAETGLIDGQQATTAWWLTKEFARRYPAVQLDADALVVRNEKFLLGGSSSSYQDLALNIVEHYGGENLVRTVSKFLLFGRPRGSQAPYAILSLTDNDDPIVAKAESWIRKNLTEDFKIEEVAEHVAVSPRTLIRHFKKSLNESPQAFVQRLRIEKSKLLLETTQLRLGEIVRRCGYNDESAFRRLFKKLSSLSPREYRRQFNPDFSGPETLES